MEYSEINLINLRLLKGTYAFVCFLIFIALKTLYRTKE
jgi:hypothetical protein